VEAIAGALTGVEPVRMPPAEDKKPAAWYNPVTRGIRLTDGTGVAVEADQHPDPLAEAIRWQICEAELMQALGRTRAINRKPHEPLNVDILGNVVLPVTVNEVLAWEEPDEIIKMAVEGIVLTAPSDMAKAWPKVWPNRDAAKYALKKITAAWRGRTEGKTSREYISLDKLPSVRNTPAVQYQPRGAKQKRRPASFDPRILPNPRAWLEKRLGALASLFHLVRRGEIAPIAGSVEVKVDDALLTTIKGKPRTILDQLYLNPRAKRPWRAPVWTESERQAFIAKTKNGPDVWQIARSLAGAPRVKRTIAA
jgi:hypothetical protein